MKSPLNILHLEDDPVDAEVVRAALEAQDVVCRIRVVDTRARFLAELERGDVDLVLADMTLPTCDGMSAIALLRERWPAIPVIIVSAKVGDELAVDTLKSGATDYVVKGRIVRLAMAVRRAMTEVEERAERVLVEARFVEAQKMEVIGRLAGGVAHDFNNIVAVIIGFTDLVSTELGPAHPLQHYLEEVMHAAQRAAALTRQLLIFSRKESVALVVLDLNTVLTDLERMLRRLVDENIDLHIHPGASLGFVKADAGYVGQVLMNLVVNARDAMPVGGTLTIATANVTVDAVDYVTMCVSDSGTGMTADVQSHLFDPFFTTKPIGKGTGLGLATCQTIVLQSGGHIGVASELGQGSVFTVFLPRVPAPRRAAAPRRTPSPLLHGTETVLVVEDEPSVRLLACGLLTRVGYTVVSAANGSEALRTAREHAGAPISLVVSDVIMPVMGGREMADQMAKDYPGLPILFTSGYTDDAITQYGVLEDGNEFLPKPYTAQMMLQRVREILDRPKTASY